METLTHALHAILVAKSPLLPVETKRILLKVGLQSYVLDFLYNHPVYRRLNFYGGTCLHVVYGLDRLSEDLDLDNNSEINLETLKDDLTTLFVGTFGYKDVSIKTQQGEKDIYRGTLKFPILNALGLSSYANEALHLKVEISHHKQVALIQNTPVFYYGRSFVPSHFSLETMMAGKMIACIERNFQRGKEGAFIKGRDFYDLLDGLAAEGTAILLSSHVLTEVEARTDRILILSGGKLVAEGTLADLRARAALPVALLVRPAASGAISLSASFPEAIACPDGLLRLSCAQAEKLPLLARIAALGEGVADLDVIPPSLEDIYSHFSRRDGQ